METLCLSQATNGSAHLYGDSTYAHFSQITESNRSRFPSLAKASPVTITLRPGDALYIPAKWWHWVKSYGERCVSVNYWFSFSVAEQPEIFADLVGKWPALQKWSNDYLRVTSKECNPDGIWIWREKFAYRERISMADFISQYSSPSRSGVVQQERDSSQQSSSDDRKDKAAEETETKPKEFAYLITLADYECSLSQGNGRLLDKLKEDIAFPFAEDVETYGCNFWMNFGGIDTGLHFDDEDGLLCVVDGTKIVTLYPPSDSIYLAPYPLEIPRLQRSDRNFMYNLYKDLGPLPGQPTVDSSSLLELTLKRAPNLARYTQKLQNQFGPGRIVYGVKNRQGVIQWEYYFYGIDKACSTFQDKKLLFATPSYNAGLNVSEYLALHEVEVGLQEPLTPSTVASKINQEGLLVYSVDLDEEIVMGGRLEKINLYRATQNEIQIPFTLGEYTFFTEGETRINSVQHIDLFSTVFANAEALRNVCLGIGIHAHDIAMLMKFCNGSPYGCRTVSIVNKREEIGVYFFGITYKTFLDFLVTYLYPPDLIEFCIRHSIEISHLQLEVGFHIPKGSSTGAPTRTAFYGLF